MFTKKHFIFKEIFEKSLDLSGSEATHIVSQLDQYYSTKNGGNGEKSVKRVKFEDDKEGMTPAGFLSCFQCQPHLVEQDASQHGTYELMSNLSDDKRTDLGTKLTLFVPGLVYLRSYNVSQWSM